MEQLSIFDFDNAEKDEPLLVEKPRPIKPVEALWRCQKCGRSIRTYEEIRTGKRIACKWCNSTVVVPAWPHWWETIILYFRTCKAWYKPWTGTIFLSEVSHDKSVRQY